MFSIRAAWASEHIRGLFFTHDRKRGRESPERERERERRESKPMVRRGEQLVVP